MTVSVTDNISVLEQLFTEHFGTKPENITALPVSGSLTGAIIACKPAILPLLVHTIPILRKTTLTSILQTCFASTK